MEREKSTMLIAGLIVVFVISLIFNFVQSSKISNAEDFSGKVSQYLIITQKECPTNSNNFTGMSKCLDGLIEKLNEKPVLVEAMFVNYYMSSVQAKGVLIFKNIGTTTFDSSKFKLFLNRELQDSDGCDKQGQVLPDSLCSLNFFKVCQPGDTLYVYYDDSVILAKSC